MVVLADEGLRSAIVQLPNSVVQESESSTSSSSFSTGGESVSVSNINGQIQIDAVLSTPDGPTEVLLRGTRAEVDAQIDALPAELATQLRSRVSY